MIKIEKNAGDICISNDVLERIAGIAATSCYGVVGMASKSAADGLAAILWRDNADKGVRVTMLDRRLFIDLHIVVRYGINIRAIAESIIHKVQYSVQEVTGLEVADVTIYVDQMKTE